MIRIVGREVFWRDKRLIWFEGGEMHVDTPAYADARGISEDDAEVELTGFVRQLIPGIPITRKEDR